MMTDETDEDADTLDDEALLSAYLGSGTSGTPSDQDADPETRIPDWPPSRVRDTGLMVDTATLDWFKTNHADWRQEMAIILRAWVAAHTAPACSGAGQVQHDQTDGSDGFQ